MRLSLTINATVGEAGNTRPRVDLNVSDVSTDNEVRTVINVAEQVIEIIRELDPSQRV
jgi:hypothetical protein